MGLEDVHLHASCRVSRLVLPPACAVGGIKGGAQRLGHKVHEGVDAGIRLMDHVAPAVERAANKVSQVAGAVGTAASMAIPFTAEIPIVGE
eukprot:SAG11_NODE_30570_length_299_cov_3.195000_1_plen_90_part_10